MVTHTKTRNNLTPSETSWNHLKPPRNDLKPPEPSYIIVLFTYLGCIYFQVLIFHPSNHLKPAESTWNHPETTWNQACYSIISLIEVILRLCLFSGPNTPP